MQGVQGDECAEETGTCLNESVKKEGVRVIDVVGGHGPWQFRHWAIFFLATFCTSMHLFSTLPLMSAASPCNCFNTSTSKEKLRFQALNCNVSACEASNRHIPRSELRNLCFVPSPQSSYRYSSEDENQCSNVAIVIYTKTLFVLGTLFSLFLAFPLMTRFGRRPVSLMCCFLLSTCSLAGIWAFSPSPYLVLRFMQSIGVTTVYLIAAFSLADCVNEEFRLLYFYTAHIGWGLAHFILPLVIWVIPNWTFFNVILSLPCFFLLLLLCFLPETAESYAAKGLWTRAHNVMYKAARCNGFSPQRVEQISPNLLTPSTDCGENVFTFNLKNHLCILEYAALFVNGFFSSLIYFTSLWLTDWLQKKRISYFSLMGTTEIASVLIILFFSYFLPFRRLCGLTTTMASVFLIIMYIRENNVVPKLSRSTYIIEMFFASASWTLTLLHYLKHPFHPKREQYGALFVGLGICLGLLGSSLIDIQKLLYWNRTHLLIISVPNLIAGICIGFIPTKYLDILHS